MSNFVRRWVLTDPYDTNAATNHYTFPRNPREMSSPFTERAITSMTTTAGKILLTEGRTPAKQWTFSGTFLHKSEIEAMNAWVYNKNRRLLLNDHFGRTISLVFTGMDLTPKRRTGYYYSHEYTVTALILKLTAFTIGDQGPTS